VAETVPAPTRKTSTCPTLPSLLLVCRRSVLSWVIRLVCDAAPRGAVVVDDAFRLTLYPRWARSKGSRPP